MADTVIVSINGVEHSVMAGTSVAAALLNLGFWKFRESEEGESRAPLCGMGICHECRATIDGRLHERTCLLPCRDGMKVKTDG